LDYLKLLENAGVKSVKFQKLTGNLAKNMARATKPAENIKALQSILKNEKIATNLTKRSSLSSIFLGGAPRLFGNRNMRILMRRTKWWLGFLDYIGVANFVGPEELAKQMGDGNIRRKMEEYNQTEEAQSNAEYDFGNENVNQQNQQTGQTQQQTPTQTGNDPIQGFLSDIFGGTLKNAAMLAI
jgi:hypothetical protein